MKVIRYYIVVAGEIIYRGSDVEHAKEAYQLANDPSVYVYATEDSATSTYHTQFLRNYLGVPQ